MVNSLKCPSSGYSYNYSGESKTGTGNTEAAANANALGKFNQNAESAAQTAAINDADTNNNCEGTCSLNISVGKAVFKQTSKTNTPQTGTPTQVDVTVTIQVPVTLGCSQRSVTAAASFEFNPVDVAIAALVSVPIENLAVLAPVADNLLALHVKTVGDLLRVANADGGKLA